MGDAQLDAAVVGVGFVGDLHARLYDEHPLTDLRVVVDLDESRARSVADAYDVPHVATSIETALDRHDLDVVTVATPEAHHREPVEAALDRDVSVLVEKPIADTVADARAMGAAADRSDGSLLVGFVCRFHPEYAAVRERIARGDLGEVYAATAARVVNRSVYDRVADWTHPMYYLAVHDVDMLRWCVGSEVESVSAEGSRGLDGNDTPAVVSTTLRFADGTVGTLETNLGRADGYPTARTDELRVTGTDGYARVVNEPTGATVVTGDTIDMVEGTHLHGRRTDMFRFQLDHFVRSVADGETPLVTWEDGLRALAVANAVIESLDTRERVAVESGI